MSSRNPLAPPQAPKPKRGDSIAIVGAILEAALELAAPTVTTNAIAERAGVGIGSLYRYFPNREAIFAEIARRHHRHVASKVKDALSAPNLSLEQAVRRVCKAIVDDAGFEPRVRRCLNLLVPFSWSKATADETYREVIGIVSSWLAKETDLSDDEIAGRVFVSFSSVRGVVAMAFLYPEMAPPQYELIDILVRSTIAVLSG